MAYLTPYEHWDLELPTVPARSFLYSVEPIGVGTADIESLTSYIARLAAVHCVSVTTFIRHILAPRVIWSRRSTGLPESKAVEQTVLAWRNQPNFLQVQSAAEWLAKTPDVEALIKSLESLTLNSGLRCLTFCNWYEWFKFDLDWCEGAPWCPTCYEEWQLSNSPIYQPLRWALDAVEICPHHRCYLQLWCSYCGASQTYLNRHKPLGHCTFCGAWLGRFVEPHLQAETVDDQWRWNQWVAEAIGALLKATPELIQQMTYRTVQLLKRRRVPELSAFLKQHYELGLSPIETITRLKQTRFLSIT
jgi:TniQ